MIGRSRRRSSATRNRRLAEPIGLESTPHFRAAAAGHHAKLRQWQIEQAENRQKTAQNPAEPRLAEEVACLKGNVEMLAVQEQQCQTALIDAESQFRAEQAKMCQGKVESSAFEQSRTFRF
jgi:hypothetical protein